MSVQHSYEELLRNVSTLIMDKWKMGQKNYTQNTDENGLEEKRLSDS